MKAHSFHQRCTTAILSLSSRPDFQSASDLLFRTTDNWQLATDNWLLSSRAKPRDLRFPRVARISERAQLYLAARVLI
jgi:hypothetical protein